MIDPAKIRFHRICILYFKSVGCRCRCGCGFVTQSQLVQFQEPA